MNPNHFVFIALILAAALPAHAHRLNVFAYVEGDRVFVESRFLGGNPAQNADVTVQDDAGKELVLGKTDREGNCSFAVPQKTQLHVVVNAGEGHRGEWIVKAEELGGAAATLAPAPAVAPMPAVTISNASQEAELEAIVERVLERKLAPIRRMLVEQAMRGPNWRDVLGGLGWIAGIVGIAMAITAHRRSAR